MKLPGVCPFPDRQSASHPGG